MDNYAIWNNKFKVRVIKEIKDSCYECGKVYDDTSDPNEAIIELEKPDIDYLNESLVNSFHEGMTTSLYQNPLRVSITELTKTHGGK